MIAKLQPNRVRRTYLGGGRIDAFCGTVRGEDASYTGRLAPSSGVSLPVPEDWMASTVTAFNGQVEIEGEGLGRLADGRLVKDAVGDLPILVKLLDSDERLVIQAHPTVPFAKARMNSPVGKTECWYFLPGTAPDACVYLGFKPGISRERWKHAFETQEGLLDALHRVPVRAGDFVFVDGGVPHAIGAGCFMIELQEPSDLMVVAERVTPSGRRIPDGKIFCGLDLDGMLDVYAYEGVEYDELCARYVRRGGAVPYPGRLAPQSPAGPRRILGPGLTDKFSMWFLPRGATLPLSGSKAVAVVTSGEGMIGDCAVRKGDRLVICGESSLTASGTAEAVVCL